MAIDDWAVVVGVQSYPAFEIDGRRLSGPDNDARAFRDWLVNKDRGAVPEDHVKLITSSDLNPAPDSADDAKPTVNHVLDAFNYLRKIARQREGGRLGRRLYIFMAGHGFASSEDQTALIMANADKTDVGPLYHWLGKYTAEWFRRAGYFDEIMLFMDCCRDEVPVPQLNMMWKYETADDYIERVKRFYAFGTRWSLEAREEKSPDGVMQGVFTNALLAGLNGKAYEPSPRGPDEAQPLRITTSSLRKFLTDRMKERQQILMSSDFIADDFEILTLPSETKAEMYATVTIRLPPDSTGKKVEIFDSNFRLVREIEAESAVWKLPLEKGFYEVQIPADNTHKLFVVDDTGDVDVNINGGRSRLVVDAEDEATFIQVRDGSFKRIARGVGRLDVPLEPGIYKVKAISGSQIHEKLIALRPGGGKFIKVPLLQFDSPIPLPDTLESNEEHESAAIDESRKVHIKAGSGSSLFTFVRRYKPEGTPRPSSIQNPAQGLTIRDIQDNLVADLAVQSAANLGDSQTNPWAACNVEVDPGFYRLRLELPSGVIMEQPIVASPQWQTHIFALQRSYDSDSGDQWADLPGASVFYTRQGAFSTHGHIRLMELAKLGLKERSQVLRKDVYEMISEDQENPMLGILGGHLLLLGEKPDYELLQTLVTNLRSLLGKHPDVEALALSLGPDFVDGSYVFEYPPMLRRSWSKVLEKNKNDNRTDLIPQNSLSDKVEGHLWGDSLWLICMIQAEPKPT